jgi:endonuclease/exonuclease/phosphatase family metal-dependent hydrolase
MAENTNRNIGFWGVVLRLINFILIIALLLSYTAQWISPELFWPLAFIGLSYPILLILNFLFTIHWIFRRRKYFIYPLITILLGFPLIGRFFQIGENSEFVDIQNPFKVVSYNVHVFDQYHSKYGSENYAKDEIFKFLEEQDADIYCFQEFYNKENEKNQDNIKQLKKLLGTPYSYSEQYNSRSKYLKIVILSKEPIKSKGVIASSNKDDEISGIYTDIEIYNNIVRVYAIHLQSFQISSEKAVLNMDFDLTSKEGQDEVKATSKMMVEKFKVAFAARSRQIEGIKQHISSSTYPVIVAGDFNDTPSSYAYGQLIMDMDDSFKENGKGFGKTYIGPYPSFRIDYILHDPSITNYKFETWHINYSDHYPISGIYSMY